MGKVSSRDKYRIKCDERDAEREPCYACSWTPKGVAGNTHKAAQENFKVLKDVGNIFGTDCTFGSTMTLILSQTCFHICPLILTKPLGIFGEARNQKEEKAGYHARQCAFKDKDPSPSFGCLALLESRKDARRFKYQGIHAYRSSYQSRKLEDHQMLLEIRVSFCILG